MKRLDRYLFTEVALPFLAAQAVFIVLFIGTEALTEATKLISRYGLQPYGVIKLLFLRIPWAMGWTMPMSVGMAVILAVGRLCKDTEYTPMVIGGMSFRRMMVPILGFAALVALLALVIEEYIGPSTQMGYYRGKQALQSKASATLHELNLRLNSYDSHKRVTLNAASLDATTNTLNDAEVKVTQNGIEQFRVRAQRAVWQPKLRRWKLYNGFYQVWKGDQVVTNSFDQSYVEEEANRAGYAGGIVFEDSPDTISIYATEKPDYLTFWEIRDRIAWMIEEGYTPREVNRVRMYLYERWTLSASCLVFVLVGAPLAVRPQRGATVGGAFALGVGLVLVYYILWNSTSRLGEGSHVPWLWAWSTDVLGAAVGLLLWRRATD